MRAGVFSAQRAGGSFWEIAGRIFALTMILSALLTLYLIAKQAFTPELESLAWPPHWAFHSPTAGHFKRVFANPELRLAVGRSLMVGTVAATLAVVLGGMLGYAMARDARHRALGFSMLSAVRLLPMVAVALPLAVVLIRLGLYDLDAALGLALVHAGLALPTAAVTSYAGFASIPIEIEEAALLDGATFVTSLIRIVVPVARRSLAAAFVLSFLLSWDEFGFSLLLQPTNRTLPPLIYYYTVFGDVGPASALALMAIVPAVAALFFIRPFLRSFAGGPAA